MKLIIAIVQDEDASRLVQTLMDEGFSATKLATTGGFLRAGNTTLLIGVEDSSAQQAISLIERVCQSRTQMTAAQMPPAGMAASAYTPYPIEITVGGATIFVLSVEQFLKV
ncbi:MAG: cyclic-di-AMP receptor [Clostridia bacterium]|nr:cyclic-di-AMP receptor [Clostridia bacterium]